jgi:hypothetical protein
MLVGIHAATSTRQEIEKRRGAEEERSEAANKTKVVMKCTSKFR